MESVKAFISDQDLGNRGVSLSSLLNHPQIEIVPLNSVSETAEVIVVPFQGRNRVSQDVRKLLDQVDFDLPVIGIESDFPLDNGSEIATFDMQLSSDLPPELICHIVKVTVRRYRKEHKLIKLRQDYEGRTREIESLVELGIEFTATLSRHELYNLIVSRSVRMVPAEFHCLMTINLENNLASLASHFGFDDTRPFLPTRRLTPEVIDTMHALRQPIFDEKPFSKHLLLQNEVRSLDRQVSSIMLVPLLSKTRLQGYFLIGNRISRPGFTDKDAEQLEMVADFAAVALENAMLYEKTETLAQIDDLTQVQNFTFTQNFLKKLTLEPGSFSILFLDLDGFKEVNKKFGHLKGNEALRSVSGLILEQISEVGVVCRFGGDEFIVILPGHDVKSAVQISTDLMTSLRTKDILPGIELSGSIGIAVYPEDGSTIQAIIQAADMAMYHSKSLGPGHVTTYGTLKHIDGDKL
jgi:diguanylate cyclase (GGDEF)-like protein